MKCNGLEFYVGWRKRRRTTRAPDQPRVKSRTVIECSMRFSNRAIHAGQDPDPVTGSVTVPVYITSTYQQPGPGKEGKYVYSRTANPTRTALEECLASLEEGRHGLAFSSGLAATTTILL